MRKAAVIACILLVVGCGAFDPEPHTDTGYVRDKKFTPAHWEDGYRTQHYTDCGLHMGYDGKLKYSCEDATRQVYESHHEYINDAWAFFLEECTTTRHEPEHRDETKCIKNWLRVDETTFHQYAIGTHYPDRK